MMLSPTPWRVSPQEHPYMWRCLMYFIGLGIAPRPPRLAKMNSAAAVPATSSPLPQVGRQEETGGGAEFVQEMSGKQGGEQARLADFPGWVHRAHDQASILQAHNVDLLFRLRGVYDWACKFDKAVGLYMGGKGRGVSNRLKLSLLHACRCGMFDFFLCRGIFGQMPCGTDVIEGFDD